MQELHRCSCLTSIGAAVTGQAELGSYGITSAIASRTEQLLFATKLLGFDTVLLGFKATTLMWSW